MAYPLSLKSGVILVDTEIIGPKESRYARMILDTGATYTMVSPDILIGGGHDLAKVTRKNPITTASGIEHCPFIKIRALSAFGHTMKNVEVCAHSLPANIPARGLLGLNFLRHFNVHLNFLEDTLILNKK